MITTTSLPAALVRTLVMIDDDGGENKILIVSHDSMATTTPPAIPANSPLSILANT